MRAIMRKLKSTVKAYGILILLTIVMLAVSILMIDSLGYGAEPIDTVYANKIVDVIYRIEGGTGTKYPFGIKSVECRGYDECRRVCFNTVRNNWRRWQDAGRPGLYFDFLADRFCPKESDPVGNRNWKRNIKTIMGAEK